VRAVVDCVPRRILHQGPARRFPSARLSALLVATSAFRLGSRAATCRTAVVRETSAKGERGTEAREFSRAVADIFLAKPIAALRDLAPAIGSSGKGAARDVPRRGYRFIPIPLVLVEVQTQFRFE